MDATVAKLITAFVALIMGAVLIGTIATNVEDTTTLTSVAGESLDITSARLNYFEPSTNVFNETLTAVTNLTETNLTHATKYRVSCTINVVTNATDGAIIPSTNYTVLLCGLKTNLPLTNVNLNVSYNYTYKIQNGAINTSKALTIANAPSGWKVDDCPIENFGLWNQTGAKMTSATDYTFTASNGQVLLLNTKSLNSSTSNTTTISYEYCGDDYMTESWARNSNELVPGFFALALLGVAAGLFYSVGKDWDFY